MATAETVLTSWALSDDEWDRAISLSELRRLPCYAVLTERQRMLVDSYVESRGDRIFAVLASYDMRDRESARVFSYEVFGSPAVCKVLDAFFQRSPFEVFKRTVALAVRRKDLTVAQIRALELQARVNGWDIPSNLPRSNGYKPVSAQEPKEFFIDQIVTLNGRKIRVTKLNAEGRPIAGDPLDEE